MKMRPPAAAHHRKQIMTTGSPGTPPRASSRQLFAIFVLAVCVFVGAGTFLFFELQTGSRGVARTWLGTEIGGPFHLVDQNGDTVSDRDLRGKWLLVYFGYTHCPDACPTALNNIALTFRDLTAPLRKEIRPVFITIDPARDTPQVMKSYVAAFDAPILALTGTAAEVAQAAKEYRVYYRKHAEPGGDYSLDHSSLFYLMDPKGRFAASLDSGDPPAQIEERLEQVIG
jgi:protein SCO1